MITINLIKKFTLQFTIKKTIINSLPTRNEPCNTIDYATCVKNAILEELKDQYNCSLLFLIKNTTLDQCSNDITLKGIKDLKTALEQEQFGDCTDQKLCNNIFYELVNPEDLTLHGKKFQLGGKTTPYLERITTTRIHLSFDGFIVEVIEDSYDYTFISIFSEIGGSIGILIGMSCMTIVEFLLDVKNYLSKLSTIPKK